MTLIVGTLHEGQVWMACDSIGSDGFTKMIVKQPKLFRKGDLIMGYTDSFRLGQLLEHNLALPSRAVGQEVVPWLITAFVDTLRTCLKNGGYATFESGTEGGGNFLIATEGRLFEVQRNYSILESTEPYAAVGSGEYHAYGALHATHLLDLPPRQRLLLALEAAAAHVTTVRGPYWIIPPGAASPEPLTDA